MDKSEPSKSLKEVPPRKYHWSVGMILSAISCLFLSLGTQLLGGMSHYHPITRSFWRYFGTLFPSICIISCHVLRRDIGFCPINTKNSWIVIMILLFLRSSFGFTGAFLQYQSLKHMEIGDSSFITNAYPVLVIFLACLLLKEKLSVSTLLATLVALFGVAVLERPPMFLGQSLIDHDFRMGSALAIGSALFLAGAIVMIRYQNLKEIHYSVILTGFAFWGTLESAGMAHFYQVLMLPENLQDVCKALAVGLLSCASQICLIFALKFGSCGPVALVGGASHFLVPLLQSMMAFGVRPDFDSSCIGYFILGASILLCCIGNCVEEIVKENKLMQRIDSKLPA